MAVAIDIRPCSPMPAPPLCIELGYGGLFCLSSGAPSLKDAVRALRELVVALNPYIPVLKLLQVVVDFGAILKALATADLPGALAGLDALAADLAAVGVMAQPQIAFGVSVLGQVQVLRAYLVALRDTVVKIQAAYARLDVKLASAQGNPSWLATLTRARCNVDKDLLRIQGDLAGAAVLLRLLNSISCLAFGRRLAALPVPGADLSVFIAALDAAIALVDDFLQLDPLPSIPLVDAC